MARFNADNAREMAARSLQARKANEEKRRQLLAQAAAQAESITADDYLSRRVLRVRTQIELLSQRIDEELEKRSADGQKLNWLCSALERLQEQERELSGRPLPGTLKPRPEPGRPQRIGPVEPLS